MRINEFKKEINDIVGSLIIFDIHEARDKDTNPTLNLYNVNDEQMYAIKLFPSKNVFLVWDIHRRRKLIGKTGRSLNLTNKTWDGIEVSENVITPQYKKIGNSKSSHWEKVYIVGINHLHAFFEHYHEYMGFNKDDPGFPSHVGAESEDIFDDLSREQYTSERWKRSSVFRDQVLFNYGYKCAICRCRLIDVLQAAHEHGFEPGNTNWDDPSHGICLCANHHLMYDRKAIDIDFKSGELTILKSVVKEMPWYRQFIEQYEGKITDRDN